MCQITNERTNKRKSVEHKLIRRKCPPSLVVNAASYSQLRSQSAFDCELCRSCLDHCHLSHNVCPYISQYSDKHSLGFQMQTNKQKSVKYKLIWRKCPPSLVINAASYSQLHSKRAFDCELCRSCLDH